MSQDLQSYAQQLGYQPLQRPPVQWPLPGQPLTCPVAQTAGSYNPPQDLVIDMNAIVADLLNNLLPTKVEAHQINLMLINSIKI